MDIKKGIISVFLILFLLSCSLFEKKDLKIIQKNGVERPKKVASNGSTIERPDDKDKEEDLTLVTFSFSNASDKAILTSKNIYKTCYEFSFRFIYKSGFKVNYKIFDENKNLLFQVDDEKAKLIDYDNDIYEIKNSFYDHTLHNYFGFTIDTKIENRNIDFAGDFILKDLPVLESLNVGPFISTFNPNSKSSQTLLKLHFTILNSTLPVWARLIPPTADFFWNLESKQMHNNVFVSGTITDDKHSDYLLNGEYILQLNFGKIGMVEKAIEVVDVFNNKKGPNYGLPIAMEESNDKNFIKISITRMDKINHLNLILYEKNGNNYKKLGTAHILNNFDKISKKDIFNTFEDDTGNKVVLQHNKKYYYQISLHSKPADIEYVSLSLYFPITFAGFGFFD